MESHIRWHPAGARDGAGRRYAVRAGMPLLFRCSFTAEMGTSRRWKMPAASAAAALVFWNTCRGGGKRRATEAC